MKRLNITKEQFNRSNSLQKKYGKLKYVSESGKLFKTSKGNVLKFNEAGPHRVADDEDLDVPVTEMEEWLCDSIPDEIEFKFNELGELDLTCGANYHNSGEEQHIEIYVGIPEGDDPTDPKYDNIEEKLEKFVNEVCEREYKFKSSLSNWKGGEKWGDASFQWISDEEIFGELWPLEQSRVNESDNSKSIKVIVRLLRPRKGEKPWTIRFTDGTSEEYDTQSEVWDRMEELGEEFAGRDRVGRDWDFISTRRKTSESTKNVNEVSGWSLEDEDLTLVNTESDGDKLYIVKLWWGSGYQMDCYNAYAFSEEEALNYVVAYIEKNDPETLEASDECAKNLLNEIEQDHISATEMGYDDDFYPEDTPEFQEAFLWVDATMEGAKKAHYIWAENLQIAEYPKEHDYPMSKGIKRESRKVKESSDGGKARIESLCANLEKQYDTLTYDEIEGKLKKAGFVLDEYGGKTNAYAVFVHDCGIVVNLEYQFVKDYGTRDSWHAGDVTYFGWYDDPDYQRWSTESTKKFGKKFKESEEGDFDDMEKEFTYLGVTITRYDYESLPLPMAASKCSDRTMQAIAKDIQEDLVALGWSPKEIRKYLSDVDNYDYEQDDTADRIKSDFWEYMEKAAVSRGMKYYEELDDEDTGY